MSYDWLETFFTANPAMFKYFYLTTCVLLISLIAMICVTVIVYIVHTCSSNKKSVKKKDKSK